MQRMGVPGRAGQGWAGQGTTGQGTARKGRAQQGAKQRQVLSTAQVQRTACCTPVLQVFFLFKQLRSPLVQRLISEQNASENVCRVIVKWGDFSHAFGAPRPSHCPKSISNHRPPAFSCKKSYP